MKKKTITYLLLILALLQALDILTTYILMTFYGAEEAVYLSRKLIEHSWFSLIVAKMGIVVIIGLAMKYVLDRETKYFKTFRNLLVVLNLYYVTPFLWNTYGILLMENILPIPTWL